MKPLDKMNDNRAIVIAAMVCVTILIYGLMQMWCADGQRYEYHRNAVKDSFDRTTYFTKVFDKRTGVFYSLGSVGDYVDGKTTTRKLERIDNQ